MQTGAAQFGRSQSTKKAVSKADSQENGFICYASRC